MFGGCSNFAITGSTFNIWYNPSPSALDEGATLVINGHQYNDSAPEFRSIRLGDIHLLSYVGERKIVEYHAVRRKKHSGTVRVVTGRTRVHHARIFPSQDVFTVVEYEGCNFARVGLPSLQVNVCLLFVLSGKRRPRNDSCCGTLIRFAASFITYLEQPPPYGPAIWYDELPVYERLDLSRWSV